MKLNQDGEHVYSIDFGGASIEEAASLEVDGEDVLLLGTFISDINFGGDTLITTGSSDIFLAKLDKYGCQIGAVAYGDPALQRAEALAIDAMGNTVLAGSFEGSVDFGLGALTAQATDAYVVKLEL